MVLEANAAYKMDTKGHKQDDPRASQNKDIAGGQNHQAVALILWSYNAS